MKALGLDVSSTQVAALYKDFLDIMVIDTEDAAEADNISDMGIRPVVLDTLMSDRSKAVDLASQVLEAAR